MLMNKNNFYDKIFFSPFASGLIDRCVIITKIQKDVKAEQFNVMMCLTFHVCLVMS